MWKLLSDFLLVDMLVRENEYPINKYNRGEPMVWNKKKIYINYGSRTNNMGDLIIRGNVSQ